MTRVDTTAVIWVVVISFISGIMFTLLCFFLSTDNPFVRTVQAPDSPPTTRTVKMRITAYCPEKCCCGRYADHVTASGHMIAYGDKFIAAPKSIPFGTWIDIEGYGYAEVLDRGGAIKGNRLDVYFDTHQEALNWGIRMIEVEL